MGRSRPRSRMWRRIKARIPIRCRSTLLCTNVLTAVLVHVLFVENIYSQVYFFPSHIITSPFCILSLLRSRNSDAGSHSRLFSPLPTTVRALHFYRERNSFSTFLPGRLESNGCADSRLHNTYVYDHNGAFDSSRTSSWCYFLRNK